jgi:hypothetical protein
VLSPSKYAQIKERLTSPGLPRTRNGRTTTLWSSKTGYVYCVAKAASLVTKLAEGHYFCKPQSVGAPADPEA